MATVTVSAATDWSASASAAIAAAVSAAGTDGTVVFPPGLYRITEPIAPLAGQTLRGTSYATTTLRVDFSQIANFTGMSVIRKNESSGVCLNPDVTVEHLCIDGGRSQCGLPNYATDPVTCPYGAAGGVSLGVRWLVSQCRITNVNGPKTGCFGAHGSRIEYCRWDNDGGGTGGDQDNIGGGGVVGLELVGNVFAENCAGSGIDITTGADVLIENNVVGFRSVIIEGIQGAVIRGNLLNRSTQDSDAGGINVKSNTAYASAQQAGAWCSTDVLVEGNVVFNSASPAIIVSSTWDDKGPGDALDAGRYGKAKGITIRGNMIVSPYGLGIYLGGQDRAREAGHAKVYDNLIVDPRQATAGLGDEWNSGSGYFTLAGIGLGSGDGVVIGRNTVVRTTTGTPLPDAVVLNGARGGSQTARSTRLGAATLLDLA